MWFLRKKKTAKTLELHAQPLKKYVSESIAFYKKKQQMQAQADKGIRYSLRDTSDDSGVRYSLRDTSDRSTYLEWEKTQKTYTSFSSSVRKYIERQQLTNREFYRRADLDRKLFSKLYNDFSYKPSRNTAIKCCLALHLNEEEADGLLKEAGFAFSVGNSFDLAIRYCIIHKLYNLDDVNALLESLEEQTL